VACSQRDCADRAGAVADRQRSSAIGRTGIRLRTGQQGQIWITSRDSTFKSAVPLYPASDEQLAAIPSSGLWIVPKPDGSGTTAGARPDWAVNALGAPVTSSSTAAALDPTVAPTLPTVPESSIKLSGERGENTKPFALLAGAYTVTWKTELRRDSASCFSAATLYRVDGKRYVQSLYSVTLNRDGGDKNASGDTEVYGVTTGQYFIEANTTACSWSVEIRPQ
jgi:hypothetical protein